MSRKIPKAADPFESEESPESAIMATKPTINTPTRIKIMPTQWCLYCLRFKKMIDIKAVITTIKPLII